jgi:hypothetical protein
VGLEDGGFIAGCRLGGDFIPLVREFNKRICYSAMKRQICSYDMLAVSSHSYTVSEEEGEMYFCNSRGLCLWSKDACD